MRFDLGHGHLFTGDRTITHSDSLLLNPIQPSLAVSVGNGKYTIATDIVSAGVERPVLAPAPSGAARWSHV